MKAEAGSAPDGAPWGSEPPCRSVLGLLSQRATNWGLNAHGVSDVLEARRPARGPHSLQRSRGTTLPASPSFWRPQAFLGSWLHQPSFASTVMWHGTSSSLLNLPLLSCKDPSHRIRPPKSRMASS